MSFDRNTIKAMHAELDLLVSTWAETYGLKVQQTRIGFTPEYFTYKAEVREVREDGLSKEAVEFLHYAKYVGLKESDLGKVFEHCNKQFKIVGYKGRSKYNILAKNIKTDRMFKFPLHVVRMALGYTPDSMYDFPNQ